MAFCCILNGWTSFIYLRGENWILALLGEVETTLKAKQKTQNFLSG